MYDRLMSTPLSRVHFGVSQTKAVVITSITRSVGAMYDCHSWPTKSTFVSHLRDAVMFTASAFFIH